LNLYNFIRERQSFVMAILLMNIISHPVYNLLQFPVYLFGVMINNSIDPIFQERIIFLL